MHATVVIMLRLDAPENFAEFALVVPPATVEKQSTRLSRAVNTFVSFSGLAFPTADRDLDAVRFLIREVDVPAGALAFELLDPPPSRTLELTAHVQLHEMKRDPGECDDREWAELREAHESLTTEMRIHDALGSLLMCATLASPGDFVIDIDNATYGDDASRLANLPTCDVSEAVAYADRVQWPPLSVVSARSVHGWITQLPGWRDSVGRGQAGRCAAAFSHFPYGSGLDHMRLVWALVGLEALYCGKPSGLAEQLAANSELLLGPRLTHKKAVAKMYKLRSQFLHGTLDLPYAYRMDYDAWEEYHTAVSESSLTATAMLIASLQEMIRRDWTSFAIAGVIVGQRERT